MGEWYSKRIEPRELSEVELNDIWGAPSGDGEFAYTWSDKPHRLIYTLLAHIIHQQNEIADIKEELSNLDMEMKVMGEYL